MATTGKKTTTTKRKAAPARRKRTVKKSDLDRRWSILLFGLGVLFIVLCFVEGESAWAWVRQNILFGAFGISGWLVGPFFLYWAVVIGLGKPVFPPIIRCILFMFAFSGAALVFGKLVFTGLKFGEILTLLLESGKTGTGGGLISLLFGYVLIALCGRPAANILMVILVLISIMVFTGVTPGDIARFFTGLADRIPEREYIDDTEPEPDPEPDFEQQMARAKPAPKPAARSRKKKAVDIDLGPDVPVTAPGGADNAGDFDIGPGGTFGLNPLGDKQPSYTGPAAQPEDEPILPFDPHSRQSLYDSPNPVPGHQPPPRGLFGEEDDNRFGAQPSAVISKVAAPKAPAAQPVRPAAPTPPPLRVAEDKPPFDLFEEAADLPQPAGDDLFGRVDAPSPVQFPKAAPAPGGVAMAGEVSASAAGEAYDEALFEKAMAKNPANEAAAADNRPEASHFQPYQYPPVTLFADAQADNVTGARDEMKKTADLLVGTLASFGVQTRILDVSRGPSVTRYEIQPQTGVKISRITNLADDIALNLAAAGVRIEAPIPGKPAVGIEVPNRIKSTVSIRTILESRAFAESTSPLTVALGKDIAGDCVVADLTRMPHLLVAGSTGSGKSVCINSIIMSILYKSSPDDVRIMLIDPKVVELAEYNGVPHLLMPVVTEPRKAAGALGQMVAEMEKRYHTFAENNVRDIKTYNKLAARKGELEKMPYIAIVIDELADLMMTSGKEVEDYICRIAQKARAAGMHLIVATQRPSVDVITGLIKANIPSRIAFAVSSQVDSRTILDGAGAEKLLGMGDMLFMPVGANKPVRVQGTYVKDKEISGVISYIKKTSGGSRYDEDFIKQVEDRVKAESVSDGGGESGGSLTDETFVAAVEIALEQGQISTSFLQRRLRLGYARAGRIMDEMQQAGIISAPEGSKPRQVLISRQQWLEMNNNALE